jgi:signal transduction histidine kinase
MRTGLRTEIILSISLLLAAALLFAGFLLLKLTERNLLDQRRSHAASFLQLLAATMDGEGQNSGDGRRPAVSAANITRLQGALGGQSDILAWRLLDDELQVVSSTAYGFASEFPLIAPATIARGDLYETLVYRSFSFLNKSGEQSYLELSTALWSGSEPYGVLQVRFSLDELQQRVWESQKLVLIYVIIYGIILAGFGVYLLNRNVVTPVRQLHSATRRVAEGTLSSEIVPSGPGEIHELAESFNSMVAALAQARDDLVRSEKLATVGHLAAGMAHEIGNPLGAVVGYLNILRDDLSGDARDLVERSLAETTRIDRLIRELLDYSAPVDHKSEAFCPITLLRETVTMLSHQGQLESIEVDDQCDAENCLVSMDRSRLMQVWINLLLNARDAMSGEGRIRLSSSREGSSIRISIADNGAGVASDVAQQIFEPFFTTKAPGSGYGLGLAICQRIIDENGGHIEVDSDVEQGACFTVTLPCMAAEPS